jgi:hypothetical protein
MANDGRLSEEEEEREFLAGLKTRTGRDLAEWMTAIAAKGFHDKNEIIDWLRTEGFPFARASWLERIHRNGGKPIHAGGSTAPSAAPMADARPAPVPPRLVVVASTPRPAPAPALATPPPVPPQPTPRRPAVQAVATPPAAAPPPPVPAAPAHPAASPAGPDGKKPAKKAAKPPPRVEPADPAQLEKLAAAAKGYRPLYHHLEAQIRRAIPGVVIAARDRYIAIGAPLEFAAINPLPTEVRLGLALGDQPFDAQLQPAKLRGPGPTITHMLVLTDARQVNDDLLARLKAANAGVNG